MRGIQKSLIRHPWVSCSLLLLMLLFGICVSPFTFQFIPDVIRAPIAVDAIPDLGENQQIVFTAWHGRSPRDVEDQITYPLSTQLMGVPGVKTIRTFSFLGFSTIYVIFEENVEFYWSRTRILEKLNSLPPGIIPAGVQPTLGPDATPLGQVFLYVLRSFTEDGKQVEVFNEEEKRTIQDFQVKLLLQSIPGVSEVASIGGFVKEFQVQLDPQKLALNKVSLLDVADVIRASNLDVGARTMEYNRVEYLVRGLGFIQRVEDLENTVVRSHGGIPILIKHLGKVQLVPAFRRGILDDGGQAAVGGIVVARYGANPMQVLEKIRKRLDSINEVLPSKLMSNGQRARLKIIAYYDRTDVILQTIETLWHALKDEVLIASMVILAFLFHAGSSILLGLILPLGILLTFVGMKICGIEANVVALSGIAIAIGVMGDMGIVLVENAKKNLSEKPGEDPGKAVLAAVYEVNGPILLAVSTTLISFLPVFFLSGAEGKLFQPLAFTKTLAILSALVIALFFLPPLSRFLQAPGWNRWNVTLAIPLFIICLIGLTFSWSPLGAEEGMTLNLLFVSLTVLGLLAFFGLFQWLYPWLLGFCFRNTFLILLLPLVLCLIGLNIWFGAANFFYFLPDSWRKTDFFSKVAHQLPGLGSEFMPRLKEGSFLYMPTAMPHAGGEEMQEVLALIDRRIASIPEVEWAVGKAGRAESALDPAPLSMIETVIQYHQEYELDSNGKKKYFAYDENTGRFIRDSHGALVEDAAGRPFRNWRERIRTPEDIWDEILKVTRVPGTTSAPFLQPIEGRIVMLQSGMRAPMGIKILGDDLQSMEAFGLELEKMLKEVPGVKGEAAFADRIVGKPYLEVEWDREALARYGISIRSAQQHVEWGIGGGQLSEIIEGRNRFPLTVRFLKDFRDSPEDLEKLLISPPGGAMAVPLSLVAKLHYRKGPQAIKGEDSKLVSYVLFDKQAGFSEGEVVENVERYLKEARDEKKLILPPGIYYKFAGNYQNQIRAKKRLMFIIPLSLLVIFLLISFQFNSILVTSIIFSSVFLAWCGGFIMIWLYGQDWFLNFSLFSHHLRDIFQISPVFLSVAVWVGFLALFGIATDDGVLMSTFIREGMRQSKPANRSQLREVILEAARRRVRPCLMTSATTILALLPILTSHGRGSEIMIPMAIPIFGGMIVALLTLIVTPLLFNFIFAWNLPDVPVTDPGKSQESII